LDSSRLVDVEGRAACRDLTSAVGRHDARARLTALARAFTFPSLR